MSYYQNTSVIIEAVPILFSNMRKNWRTQQSHSRQCRCKLLLNHLQIFKTFQDLHFYCPNTVKLSSNDLWNTQRQSILTLKTHSISNIDGFIWFLLCCGNEGINIYWIQKHTLIDVHMAYIIGCN